MSETKSEVVGGGRTTTRKKSAVHRAWVDIDADGDSRGAKEGVSVKDERDARTTSRWHSGEF